jgi:hypothetical protein
MRAGLDPTKVREERQTTIDEWRHRISSQRLAAPWRSFARPFTPTLRRPEGD